jgi:uncharacterized membrane protein YeaQ/YmgE (transglycosylase-associated protein family)
MTWTTTNLIIQIVAGILAGNAAAALVHEHSFGLIGHTITGAIGGAASGYFLQRLAVTVVTASGSLNEPTAAENAMLQALTGAAIGALLTLIVGFAKHSIDQHPSASG